MLALTLPAEAIAADRDCDAISALTSASKSELRKVAITINRDDRLDVTYAGKAGLLRGASYCDISSEPGHFTLSCHWDFGSD